jgi:hypothetical protein
MKTESQIKEENHAAVNLLVKLIEEKQKKTDIVEWKNNHKEQVAHTGFDNVMNIWLYLEIQLLNDNIERIKKMIESQVFDY